MEPDLFETPVQRKDELMQPLLIVAAKEWVGNLVRPGLHLKCIQEPLNLGWLFCEPRLSDSLVIPEQLTAFLIPAWFQRQHSRLRIFLVHSESGQQTSLFVGHQPVKVVGEVNNCERPCWQ
jgi:hypothetical protein